MEHENEGHAGDGNELALRPGAAISVVSVLEAAIARMANGTATSDDVLIAIDAKKRMNEILTALKAGVEKSIIEWIDTNGEVTCGEVRYYVGPERKTRCLDQRGTLDAILDETGGDVDKVVSCLSANCFKPGATANVLSEERYSQLFRTEEVLDLKSGKVKRVVNKADPRFMRPKVSNQGKAE